MPGRKPPEQEEDILKLLREHGYGITEMEKGILGYIKDMQMVRVTFTDSIALPDRAVTGRDIYTAYYGKE
jgi:hypothetical protein